MPRAEGNEGGQGGSGVGGDVHLGRSAVPRSASWAGSARRRGILGWTGVGLARDGGDDQMLRTHVPP
jgi:hypothetical protein